MGAVNQGATIVDSLLAGGDLSSSQFRFVKMSGTTVVAVSGATDQPVGVLQNTPASGELATFVRFGPTKLEASAAITAGARIGPSANGRGVTYTPNHAGSNWVCGRARDAAANAGDIIPVFVDCVNQVLGA